MIDFCRHFPIVKVMKGAEHITDEMLTRWLCGQSFPDEEAAVLDYLAESDERIDDLSAISAAVNMHAARLPERRTRLLWPLVSAAASVALLIGIGLHIHNSGSAVASDPSPAYATQDSITSTEMEDTI